MVLKALLFVAACLAVASAAVYAPLVYSAADDGSYWRGKYDLRELHPALPSVRGWAYPHGAAYWH